MKAYLRSVGVARMLRHVGVAPAPRTRFLAGQRALLLTDLGLTAIIDVGANFGQYGQEVRAAGFEGRLFSFEPGSEALERLHRASAGDALWHVFPTALGSANGEGHLQAWRGESSSAATLRQPVQGVTAMLGAAAVEAVEVQTLASWLRVHREVEPERSLLKIDVQGSEREVLAGARDRLAEFAMIEIEAPLGEWYEGEASLGELLSTLADHGFLPVSIMTERFNRGWRGAADVDVLLVRRDLSRLPR